MRVTKKMQAAATLRRHALELAASAKRLADAAGVAGGQLPGEAATSASERRDQIYGELHTLNTLVGLVQADWRTYERGGDPREGPRAPTTPLLEPPASEEG